MAVCQAYANASTESWNQADFSCLQPDEASPRAVDISDLATFGGRHLEEPLFDDQIVPLRLVTYNIHGWRDTFHNDNLDRIIALLARLDIDVICLQEVLHPYRPPADPAERAAYFDRVKAGKGNGFETSTPSWGDSDGDARPYLDELAAALGMPHISFGCATSDGYFGRFGYGNAVLSRRPIAREEHLVVRPAAKHQAGRRIEAEDRCFSAVILAASSSCPAITVCVTHLDQLSDELRLDQVPRPRLVHRPSCFPNSSCLSLISLL
jgi:endonuclease/exonuclease/phosphatase family metal-dependent hydrolase